MLVNCEGWSNEAGLGRSSNRWQDGSRVGCGGVGVAVSCLGMRHWPLTRTDLPSATLRDRWWCGQRDGSLSHVVVAWAAAWISLSLASHCLCLASLFSFLFFFLRFSLVPFGFGLLVFFFFFLFYIFLFKIFNGCWLGWPVGIGWIMKIRGAQVILIGGSKFFFFFFFLLFSEWKRSPKVLFLLKPD